MNIKNEKNMKNILFFVLAGLMGITLCSCASNKQISAPTGQKTAYNMNEGSQSQAIPSWYLNPQPNTELKLFGMGQGHSFDESRNNALNNISKRLIVKIRSSFQSQTSSSGTNYQKDITNTLNVSTEQMQFTNPKLERSALNKNIYYTEFSINKKTLLKQLNGNFHARENSLEHTYKKSENKNNLEQIKALQSMQDDINANKSLALKLYALNNKFAYSKYISKYNSYTAKLNNLKSSTSIKILSIEANGDYFKTALSTLLTKAGFELNKSHNDGMIINIVPSIQYFNFKGWYIAKASSTLSISYKDKQGDTKVMKSLLIKSTGRSSQSKQSALIKASQDFLSKIQKLGMERLLF